MKIDGRSYFAVENIRVHGDGEFINLFRTGEIPALNHNH